MIFFVKALRWNRFSADASPQGETNVAPQTSLRFHSGRLSVAPRTPVLLKNLLAQA